MIRAVDGPLVSVYGLRPEAVSYNESAEILQHVWIAARSSLREVFENVTIEALAAPGAADRGGGAHPRRGRLAAALSLPSGTRRAGFTVGSPRGRGLLDASVAWHDES